MHKVFCSISKNTKAVYAHVEKNKLTWIVYFDEEPLEKEKERLKVALTEILCDLPEYPLWMSDICIILNL